MSDEEVFEQYEQHLAEVDSEFRRTSEIFSGRMQCRRGCAMCCSQMFSVSALEAAHIARAVGSMPEHERSQLRAAALAYVAEAKKLAGGEDGGEESFVPRPGLRLPCPALKGDACSIYDVRPIICRKWGIPLFNPKKPAELQACELNFRPGEEIDVEDIIEPQVALLEQWVEIKDRARRHLAHPGLTATIAEAILLDYEELLPGRAGTSRDG